MSATGNSTRLPGDNPIGNHGDDLLERTGVADPFARQVLALDASEGATVGVFGPWGSGKTSFVNLARCTFKRANVPVLDFNPWMFSGAEQLVERFFAELSTAAGMREIRGYGCKMDIVVCNLKIVVANCTRTPYDGRHDRARNHDPARIPVQAIPICHGDWPTTVWQDDSLPCSLS